MIAPHELKKKVFNKAVRGYNPGEVDDYIEFVIDQYTELYRENSALKDKLHSTEVKYSELHNDEDSIRAVIMKAQKLAENIINQAKNEANTIISSAKEKCQEKIDEAERKVAESNKELEGVRGVAEDYRAKLYSQYLEHIKLIKEMDLTFPLPADGDIRDEVNELIDKDVAAAKAKISDN